MSNEIIVQSYVEPGAQPGFYFRVGGGPGLKNFEVTFLQGGQKCSFLMILLVYPKSEECVTNLQVKLLVNYSFLKNQSQAFKKRVQNITDSENKRNFINQGPNNRTSVKIAVEIFFKGFRGGPEHNWAHHWLRH